jgi:hypothetical protein
MGPEDPRSPLGDLEDLDPYLGLAREIRREVERIAADDAADAESIVEAIARFPREERQKVARAVFDALSAEAQWAVLERAFGDEEIRAHLQAERDARLARLGRDEQRRALTRQFRSAGEIDTRLVPTGETLTLGLFREQDVRAAILRGSRSTTAARRLVLRADEAPTFRVIEDVFNPDRGYFVTSGYDERVWRSERLDSHQLVGVGWLLGDSDADDVEPVLVPGSRVDVRTDAGAMRGRLHLGFAMLAEDDVFAG